MISGGDGAVCVLSVMRGAAARKLNTDGYAGRYLSDLSDNLDTLEEVRAENEELQSKVDQLSIDNTRLRQ